MSCFVYIPSSPPFSLADGLEAYKKGVVGFVPRLCEMVVQDPEHQVSRILHAITFIAIDPYPKYF